ncbi:MAG: Rne/Rng family ribonuclease [Parvularculaceae bacterium]
MTKTMLIDAAHREEVRVALIDNGKVEDFDFESSTRKPLRGNIYLARVTRVEPSLQAAFVEYGGNRHGFLAFSEIHPDYYQIPVSDRELLQAAEAEEAALAAELELAHRNDEADDEDFLQNGDDGDGGEATEAEAQNGDGDVEADNDESGAKAQSDDGETDSEDDAEEDSEDTTADADAQFSDEASGADEAPEAEDEAAARPSSNRTALLERYHDAKRKRARLLRNYKIQEVVKRRQILLVQVVKEERGTKGAALTTYISLAGRYCVLMPNTARGGGISRKIPSASDRRRLRKVVDGLDVPDGMGLIIRTAGAKRTKAEIKRDYDYLLRLWDTIRNLTLKSIAPCLIYEEASLIKRAIRDLYDKDISKVLVDGETGYREAKDFMKMLMPSHAKYVQPYKDRTPLFLKFDIERQLDAMYQPTVRLKSGGYIVIHQTEALVAIDVNSGKATRERNIELTALKTNIEAAQEVARQCRVRDLAGLIVIDFIDMEEMKNNRAVERKLKDALKDDRARLQAGRISSFGLLEMSRQRRRSGIVDGTTRACPTCAGAGVVRSHETTTLRILRAIEGEALSGKAGIITARTSLDVALYILNNKRDWLKRIEDDNGVTIEIAADEDKAGDLYDIEKRGAPRECSDEKAVIRADQPDIIEEEAPDAAVGDVDEEGEKDRGGRKKRRRRKRRAEDAAPAPEPAAAAQGEAQPEEPAAADKTEGGGEAEAGAEDAKPKRRRRRGRRGGRRNRRGAEAGVKDAAAADQAGDAGGGERTLAAEAADDGVSADAPGARAPQQTSSEGGDETRGEAEAAKSPDHEPKEAEPAETSAAKPPAKKPARKRRSAAKAAKTADNGGENRAAPAASGERSADAGSSEEPANAGDAPDAAAKPVRKGWWQRALGG